jgi:hypothetical protein
MLEAYYIIVKLAFTKQNIKSGWRKIGIYPINKSLIL